MEGGRLPSFGELSDGWGFSGKWLLQEPGLEGRQGRVGWGGDERKGLPGRQALSKQHQKGRRERTGLSGGKEALSQHRAGLPRPIRRRRGQGLSRSADVSTHGRPRGPPFLCRRGGGHAPPEQGGREGAAACPGHPPGGGCVPPPGLCAQEVRAVGGHGGLSVVSLPGPPEATLEPRGHLPGRLIHPLAQGLTSSDKPLVSTNSLLAMIPLPQLPPFPRAAPPTLRAGVLLRARAPWVTGQEGPSTWGQGGHHPALRPCSVFQGSASPGFCPSLDLLPSLPRDHAPESDCPLFAGHRPPVPPLSLPRLGADR